MKTSIIIPARDEEYLARTVNGVFERATGEIEVIVVIDGPSHFTIPHDRPGLTVLHNPRVQGLRPCVNRAAIVATGEYLMKLDAHCAVSEGFDAVLKADCEPDWVVVSRYYPLNVETWTPTDAPPTDSFYLACPWTNPRYYRFTDYPWHSRNYRNRDVMIDETLGMQASLWFMHISHFREFLGGLDERRWGTWAAEQREIAMKTWLGGGRVVVNKQVWNAHYQRTLEERRALYPEYSKLNDFQVHRQAARYWMGNQWEKQTRTMEWLIDHFWPLPTATSHTAKEKYVWPVDWRDYLHRRFPTS